MNFLTNLVDGVEQMMYLLARGTLLSDATAYCHLETAIGGDYDEKSGRVESPTTFVTKQNTLVTVCVVNGTTAIIPGEAKHQAAIDFCANLAKRWGVYLKKPGHRMGVIFERDPTNVERTIKTLLAPAIQSTKKLKLDVSDIFESKVATLSKHCASEVVYLVISTELSALSPPEAKHEALDRIERAKQVGFLPGDFSSQNFYAINKALISKHNSFASSFLDDMKKCGLLVSALDAHVAGRGIRMAIDPELTDIQWRPVLPGDKFLPRQDRNGKKQILPKSLGMQLLPRGMKTHDEIVQIGNRFYGTGSMECGPSNTEMFDSLFGRVPKDIPWRVAFDITPDGVGQKNFSKMITGVLGFISDSAKQIKASFDWFDESRKNDQVDVGMRVVFQTWGENKKQGDDRLALLSRAVQGWGGCDTSSRFGDPVVGFVGAIPAYSNHNGAGVMPTPLLDAVTMLPLARAASPWPHGAALFRTGEGRIFPMQPGSSLQDTWADLFFAPPGSGKSLTMNMLNLATCFAPGLLHLPYLRSIDIGVSSSGLIEAIKSGLPDNMKHLCVYRRLQNNEEWAINPLDTEPGCRFPSDVVKNYVKALLVTLATPIGENVQPYPAADGLADELISQVYKKFTDKSPNRKMYQPTVDEAIDEALKGLNVLDDSSWWEVTDLLWKAGKKHESTLAQRYAMPTLPDIAGVCSAQEVRAVYAKEGSEIRIDTGEFLVDAMERFITTATNQYPLLSTTTRMDLGEARVVSLDLNDVAPDGGPAEKRQSAIFFMFARHLLTKDIFINSDTAKMINKNCPEMYHQHHIARATELESVMKCLSIDELHRTNGIPGFRTLLKRDLREGRKWFLKISLASQYMNDFDDEMIKSATSIYAMRYIDEASTEELRLRFGFSATALERFKYECLGPTPTGAPFLVLYKTKLGTIEQLLVNTASPLELWALTTTAQDMGLRKRVYEKLPGKFARQALSAIYPAGSCQRDFEKRSLTFDSKDDLGLLDVMAAEVCVYAEKHLMVA
ncbi:MAG: hypothetical protein Q7K26_01770 [bacterium]|nr:hypothetical protein [bacterium]